LRSFAWQSRRSGCRASGCLTLRGSDWHCRQGALPRTLTYRLGLSPAENAKCFCASHAELQRIKAVIFHGRKIAFNTPNLHLGEKRKFHLHPHPGHGAPEAGMKSRAIPA
jgi:hypothetical protein